MTTMSFKPKTVTTMCYIKWTLSSIVFVRRAIHLQKQEKAKPKGNQSQMMK